MNKRGLPLRRFFERQGASKPAPKVPPLLVEANQAFNNQDYGGAAQRFEQLAEFITELAPRRAPQILLQAGRAYILAGRIERGMALVMRALSLLAAQQRWDELRRKGPRIAQFLQNRGRKEQAEQVKEWLRSQRVTGDEASGPAVFELDAAVPKTGSLPAAPLPTRCPSCSAPVDSREVDWADARTAECPYCGAMIQAKE